MEQITAKNINTIVVGAGQAGLSAGYYLKKHKIEFVILDESESVGHVWSSRWDSLKLFTPAQYNGLPGLPFPTKRGTFPSKTEMAAYLNEYAAKFELPVILKKKVLKVNYNNSKYEIITNEETLHCDNLVVATGANQIPFIPSFKSSISFATNCLHSSQYKNPSSLSPGSVLVVGAGASGVQIAIDLSKTHQVCLAGKPTFHIPDFVFKYFGRFYWWFINQILTIKTPAGRNAKKTVLKGGAPLINVSMKDVYAAGVKLLPRVEGIRNGLPEFADGRVMAFDNIVWATGFKPDFSWINMELPLESGWPKTDRGVSAEFNGLYFVGMVFQYGLTSAIIGGVGRDAEHVCKSIMSKNHGKQLLR